MKKTCMLLALVLILMGCTPTPPTTTYRNPVLTGMNPDPSICRVGDDFYMVTSTFEYYPGLPIYHSKDLVHWKLLGYALNTPSSNPLKGCVASYGGQYAPTLRYHDGTFYVIGTNYGGEGSRGIFYVSATNPAGPWSEPTWIDQWYVDPSLEFINDTVYFLSPDNAGSFLLGTIDLETGKFMEPLRKVASGLGGSSPEGPHFYKINNYYYIMSAEGGTGYEHREVIQRSKSPWGPYEPSPINPVLSNMNAPDSPIQAAGHADIVQLKDSSWWVVCLGIRPQNGRFQHLGRETFLAPLTWSQDGWPKAGTDGIIREEYPAPNLPAHIWEQQPSRDDFNSDTLQLYWNFLRNPYPQDWSLTERKGFLRLKGSALNLSQPDSPAFICRRQTAFNVHISSKVDFLPEAENEEAGLLIRANDKNHYDLLITRRDNQRVVMLRKCLQDKDCEETFLQVPDGDIILHIQADSAAYRFEVETADGTRQPLGTASTKDVSNEVIGGFTGVFIGMYASGNGSANTHPADFDWFDFQENPEENR